MKAPAFDRSEIAVAEFGEADFQAFFALATVGVVQVDAATGRFLRVNQGFADLVGYSPSELEKLTFLGLTHPADVAENRIIFERMLRAEITTVTREKRLLRKDGAWLWVIVTAAMVRDGDGRPLRTVAVIQDITDRKRRELKGAVITAVQETFSQLRNASDIMDAVSRILCRALEIAHIGFISFGENGEPLLLRHGNFVPGGRNAADFVVPAIMEELDAGTVVAITDARRDPRLSASPPGPAEPIAIAYIPHPGEGRCCFVVTAQDPRPRMWQAHEIELLRDVGGRIWLLLERNRAETALRENETRLRRAMAVETVGVVFFHLAGPIRDANDAFLRLTGYSAEELRLGLIQRERIISTESLARINLALTELGRRGRTQPYEVDYRCKDGSHRTVLSCACLVAEEEAVEFVIDITERKQAEAQLGRYRHDLEQCVLERTAELDAANGALRDEILERARSEAERRDLMAQLVALQEDERRRLSRELHDQVGQLITGLILGLKTPGLALPGAQGRLRDLQQLAEKVGKEVHDLALILRPTALDDLGLVRTLENFVTEWSGRAQVEVDFHASDWRGDRLPAAIETTIYRIVCEAFTNIHKHAAASHVSLILKRDAGQATAIIEDDGCGFDLEKAPLLGAARLGITGMRERAALVKGEVAIESGRGQGTTVFVRIPL